MRSTLANCSPAEEVVKALRVFDAEDTPAGQVGTSGLCHMKDLEGVLKGLGFDEQETREVCRWGMTHADQEVMSQRRSGLSVWLGHD